MAISEAIWWAYELLFNICATSQDPLPISLPVSCLCMRLGFQQIQIRSLWLQTTSCQNDGWFTVYMYWHWHHCPSFLHDLLVSLPLIHSLSLPLLVFMLPYVFYNCFYETTHNIYRQKISWPTNEQLQHLSCRRLLTHTDTANSRAASITATYYYRQRRYHLYQLFTFTLNHHQWVWHDTNLVSPLVPVLGQFHAEDTNMLAPAVQLCVINLMNHLYLQHAKHSTSEMLLLAQPGQGHRAACFESDADW